MFFRMVCMRNPFRYAWYFFRCFFVFKNPISVIFHYVRKISPGENIVKLRNGLKIFLSGYPHDIITVFVVVVKEDYGKVVRDDIVIDIGANIGVFSVYAAAMGAKKVFSYEPTNEAYEVLLRNISSNRFEDIIIPYRLAVTEANGKAVRIPLKSSPYNRILDGNASEPHDVVSTVSLESILKKNGIDQLDLLKIDCEGEEYRILLNTDASIFQKIKTIRMEYHAGPLEDLISFLRNRNFHTVYHNTDSAILWFSRT